MEKYYVRICPYMQCNHVCIYNSRDQGEECFVFRTLICNNIGLHKKYGIILTHATLPAAKVLVSITANSSVSAKLGQQFGS